MKNLSGINKINQSGIKRKPEEGQNKPAAETLTFFPANKRNKVSPEHNTTPDTALVPVKTEELNAENNTNSATAITHTSPLNQTKIKHEEEDYNADTDNEEAPLTVKEEEESDDEGSQLPLLLQERLVAEDTQSTYKKVIDSSTAPEAVKAISAHVKLVEINSGISPEAIQAIPKHIWQVKITRSTGLAAIKSIPHHVLEVIIPQIISPEAFLAIPEHIKKTYISSDVAITLLEHVVQYLKNRQG